MTFEGIIVEKINLNTTVMMTIPGDDTFTFVKVTEIGQGYLIGDILTQRLRGSTAVPVTKDGHPVVSIHDMIFNTSQILGIREYKGPTIEVK